MFVPRQTVEAALSTANAELALTTSQFVCSPPRLNNGDQSEAQDVTGRAGTVHFVTTQLWMVDHPPPPKLIMWGCV